MDSEGAVDLLKMLKDLPITLEVLQKTRIGMSVNTLRKKSKNADLQTQAKTLIKSWKKLLPGKVNFLTQKKLECFRWYLQHFPVITTDCPHLSFVSKFCQTEKCFSSN